MSSEAPTTSFPAPAPASASALCEPRVLFPDPGQGFWELPILCLIIVPLLVFDANDHVCVVLFQTPLLQMNLPILRLSVTIRSRSSSVGLKPVTDPSKPMLSSSPRGKVRGSLWGEQPVSDALARPHSFLCPLRHMSVTKTL